MAPSRPVSLSHDRSRCGHSEHRVALLMNFLDTPEKRDRRLVHLPMGRFGEAVEQARAVLFCESLIWAIEDFG